MKGRRPSNRGAGMWTARWLNGSGDRDSSPTKEKKEANSISGGGGGRDSSPRDGGLIR